MKIWLLQADANNYNNFTLVDGSGWKQLVGLESFAGKPMQRGWIPYQVKIIKERKAGDMQAFFGGVSAVNQKTINTLDKFFNNNIEFLLLDYEKEPYYAINILEMLDCIDYERSLINRFSDGNIMSFDKYAFVKEKVEKKHIFKIIDEPRKFPFVSDEFRQQVIDNGLTGFLFSEVWSSEE